MAHAKLLTTRVSALARRHSSIDSRPGGASLRKSAFTKRVRSSIVASAFFGGKNDGEKERIATLVDTKISEHTVIVWSKSYCPFCVKAKAALDAMEVDYLAVEIDRISEEKLIQNALNNKTGQRTVPNVFIDGEHVGGCDNTLAEIASGKLQTRLTDAGVTFI